MSMEELNNFSLKAWREKEYGPDRPLLPPYKSDLLDTRKHPFLDQSNHDSFIKYLDSKYPPSGYSSVPKHLFDTSLEESRIQYFPQFKVCSNCGELREKSAWNLKYYDDAYGLPCACTFRK